MHRTIRASIVALSVVVALSAAHAASSPPARAQAPRHLETATFAGGCFWSMNAIFERLKGVDRVVAGFSGGSVASPSYETVCTGTTGHAETVQIFFDPAIVSYRDLLHVFFAFHDPTTLNRQGADVGTQYRSAIFFHTPAQKADIDRTLAELKASKKYPSAIVTQVLPYKAFYPAEDYHQAYYDKNEDAPYCQFVIAPKVEKLKKLYGDRMKPSAM